MITAIYAATHSSRARSATASMAPNGSLDPVDAQSPGTASRGLASRDVV
jgi:hypothetical protein